MERLGRYRVSGGPLGRGYQAAVVIPAIDPSTGREVAIKAYERGLEANELVVAAALKGRARSPFLIEMLDQFQLEGLSFLVMERGGLRLGDGDRCAPRPAGLAVQILANLLRALGELHRLGFLYLDLHPRQVLIAREDPATVRLIDFGAAVARGAGGRYRGRIVAGCLPYCPPERFRRASVGPEYDLYMVAALGCCLLTGAPPFARRTGARALADRRRGPDLSAIPSARLARVLARAMAFEPSQRYRSARRLLDALGRAAQVT